MAHRRQNHFVRVYTFEFSRSLVHSGSRRSKTENFNNGTPLPAAVTGILAADIVGGNPALFVCRSRKRDKRWLSRNEILYLRRVANGVHVGSGGFHSVVHDYAAFNAEFESRFLGKRGIRRYTYRYHRHVRYYFLAAFNAYSEPAFLVYETFHSRAELEFYAVPSHFGMNERRHILVERRHELRRRLD